MTSLRRTRIGSLKASGGVTVDDLHSWQEYLITPLEALSDLPKITVGEETANAVSHGVPFVGGELVSIPEAVSVLVVDSAGDLIAVYTRDGDQARPEVVLPR